MNTVERIRELEPKAEKTSALGSKLHWEVAELYWIAIEKDGITKASLARQVGKTAMHVLYMYGGDRIVAKPGLVWDGDYGNLPSFYQTYNSDDVRSPEEDENGQVVKALAVGKQSPEAAGRLYRPRPRDRHRERSPRA